MPEDLSKTKDATQIALRPEAGWTELDPEKLIGENRSFVSGEPAGSRLRVRYFRREADGALTAKVWFGPQTQGPPGYAHGGSMAAILDEAMGFAAWLAGHTVLAARVTVDFRRPLPLGTVAAVEAHVEAVEGRKVRTRGRILAADGSPFAEGEGLFIEVSLERFGGLRPPAFG